MVDVEENRRSEVKLNPTARVTKQPKPTDEAHGMLRQACIAVACLVRGGNCDADRAEELQHRSSATAGRPAGANGGCACLDFRVERKHLSAEQLRRKCPDESKQRTEKP